MNCEEFLRTIWPSTGPYCLAYQFQPKNNPPGELAWVNVAVDTVEDALDYINKHKAKRSLYYAMFSLAERSVFDPKKKNHKTGLLGADATRPKFNMLATKCFFFDIDVGPKKPYATQLDAVAALKAFTTDTRLPLPTVVSSGNGIHAYWFIDAPLAAAAWLPTAERLKQLAQHHGFKVDPSRIVDVSSVLRPIETLNHKDPANPKPVQLLKLGPVTAVKKFQTAVADAQTRTGLALPAPTKPSRALSPFGESNLTATFDGPLVTLPDLITACAQAKELLISQKNPSHPYHDIDNSAWYHSMGLIRWVEDGDNWCRKITAANPRTRSDVEASLTRLATFAPSKCQTIRDHMPWGASLCHGCPNSGGQIGVNPLIVARRSTPAPAPVLQRIEFGQPVEVKLPDPPKPYIRLKSGGVGFAAEDDKGNVKTTVIYPYDLYPIRRLANADHGSEQQVWCVALPRAEKKQFLIDAHALYDTRKFTEVISNNGIYPLKAHVPYLQEYMVAYINELQKLIDAEAQLNHLGWSEDFKQFILPDVILSADGTSKVASLSVGAARSSQHVGKSGTLEGQVEALKFYDNPEYLANQLFILGGLASTLLFMTDKHGVIINASGPAGSSKSTTLYTASGLWGEPERYSINGTNSGATTKGRNERVTTMANLPICVDEITHLPNKEVTDLAMGISQPGHRIRLQNDGVERKSTGGHKSTIMLATANTSLHSILSNDNSAGTAGSMRVFEIEFRPTKVHSKVQADQHVRNINQHFGHIGPEFAKYAVQNLEKLRARVILVQADIDRLANIQPSERYWSAGLAVIVVAAEVARALGLLSYDPAAVRDHAIHYLIPRMRGVVQEEYSDPMSILADYLESIQGNMLWIKASTLTGGSTAGPFAHRHPHGALFAHYDMTNDEMYVLKKGFKNYCTKIGANALQVLDTLNQPQLGSGGTHSRIVLDKNVRKVLGAGTDYAKTQSYCFVVNMAHPDVTGGIDRKILSGEAGRQGPAVITHLRSVT